MEHYELVQEMGSVERMATQDRLKHARKRRAQQMKHRVRDGQADKRPRQRRAGNGFTY